MSANTIAIGYLGARLVESVVLTLKLKGTQWRREAQDFRARLGSIRSALGGSIASNAVDDDDLWLLSGRYIFGVGLKRGPFEVFDAEEEEEAHIVVADGEHADEVDIGNDGMVRMHSFVSIQN